MDLKRLRLMEKEVEVRTESILVSHLIECKRLIKESAENFEKVREFIASLNTEEIKILTARPKYRKLLLSLTQKDPRAESRE